MYEYSFDSVGQETEGFILSLSLRFCLIIGACISCVYVLHKIRNSKMRTENSLFWFLFSFVLVVLGVFPGIAIQFAGVLGVQSPVNLVFLIVIFLLVIKSFIQDQKYAQLESKLKYIAQRYAIDQRESKNNSNEE